MAKTRIEWAEAVWNPVTGCSKVSAGCQHCYAERMAKRLAGHYGYPSDEPFRVTLHPEKLEEPLQWRKPRRVFVCSMGDLFHPNVPEEFISAIFCVMQKAIQHTFLLLTKRPERMAEFVNQWVHNVALQLPPPNIWAGVTIENQDAVDKRIIPLLHTEAAVRFVSCEPLLGPINLETQLGNADESQRVQNGWHGIDWVISGGETGPYARPCKPDWVRNLRDQCKTASVPFFFKKWGEWREAYKPDDEIWSGNAPRLLQEHDTFFLRIGKKRAGHLLDGEEWRQLPKTKGLSND